MPADHSALDIRTDLESDPWRDLASNTLMGGHLRRIGLLRHGTTGGNASVALAIQLDDGRWVCAETTWRLFHAAARTLAASPVIAEEDPSA